MNNKNNNRRSQKNRQRNRNHFAKPADNTAGPNITNEAKKEEGRVSAPSDPSQPMSLKKDVASPQIKRPNKIPGNHPRHKLPFKKNHIGTPPGVKSGSSFSKNQDDKSRHDPQSKYSDQRNHTTKNDKRGAHSIKEEPGERRVNAESLNLMELPPEVKSQNHPEERSPNKKYGVIFYDSFNHAKNDFANLQDKKNNFDQINIVIKEDGNMEDADLLKFGKVYSGAAWYLVHERRVQENWYNSPHE